MPEARFDYTILASDDAQLLVAFSILVVAAVWWIKKRTLKFQERRSYWKRQKAGSAAQYLDDRPIQLEFDF